MKQIKYPIIISISLAVLVLLFTLEIFPENFQPQEILNVATDKDVIIIFNSGGWGDTPLKEADDFIPIIEGIQETLGEWGYDSVVVPYNRTKDDLLGRISGTKDILSSFQNSSEDLAEKIDYLAKELPDKKFIIAGLSTGASFAVKTYEKVSEEIRGSVYIITAGTPFWTNISQSENLLQLDNNKKDNLARGNISSLLRTFVSAPFKWFSSKLSGENITLSRSLEVFGHKYAWSSPEVGPQVITFLENKFR